MGYTRHSNRSIREVATTASTNYTLTDTNSSARMSGYFCTMPATTTTTLNMDPTCAVETGEPSRAQVQLRLHAGASGGGAVPGQAVGRDGG